MQFCKLLDENLAIKGKDAVDLSGRSFVLSVLNDFEDGGWRYNEFNRFIWNNVALTALSKRERDSLTGDPHTILALAAKIYV